jgi:hypothetical protein
MDYEWNLDHPFLRRSDMIDIMNTESQIAWCAGIYEGEGSLSRYSNSSPALRVQMCDGDVLERFQAIMGGRLSGPYTDAKRPGRKPWWHWSVTNWDDVIRITRLFAPWMGKRRLARFEEVLALVPANFRRPLNYLPCDYEPVPSVAGYLKHRRKGERACSTCMKSARLYYANYLPKYQARKAAQLQSAPPKDTPNLLDDARLSAVPVGPSALAGSDPVS